MKAPYISELESSIENAVVKHAKEKGCMSRKMNGMGYRSWPDRLFIFPNGKVIWIEFKRMGGQATKAQAELHVNLANMQQTVYVIDNILDGKAVIDAHV
jgi:hypothetical protein